MGLAYSDCRIRVDRSVRHDWPTLIAVVCHEVGHTAGRGHARNPRSVMHPRINQQIVRRNVCRDGQRVSGPGNAKRGAARLSWRQRHSRAHAQARYHQARGDWPLARRRKAEARKAHQMLDRTRGCTGLDAHQRGVVRTALREARRLEAKWRPRVALIAAGIVETGLRNLRHGHADSEGWLQARVGIHGRRVARSVKLSTRKFLTRGFWTFGGAMRLARSTSWPPGRIAQAVQGSAFPAKYGRVIGRAARIVRCF